MFTSMESYLRRGHRLLRQWMLLPWVRNLLAALACSGGGFLCSAGSLLRQAQPIAFGLILSLPGWKALAAGLGAMAGYWVFWRQSGLQGVVWSAAGMLLGSTLGETESPRPLLPAIAAFLTAVTGLVFRLLLKDAVSPWIYLLRLGVAFFGTLVFRQRQWRHIAGGLVCLCLAQTGVDWLNPGIALGAWLSLAGGLPGGVPAGIGLDIAGVTNLPMTAALALGWLLTLLPTKEKWSRCLMPGLGGGILALLTGSGGWEALPSLLLGGALGYFSPPVASKPSGQTAAAQVRLELAARVMGTTEQFLSGLPEPAIDEGAILHRVRQRACGNCPGRKDCTAELTVEHLHQPLEVDCQKQGRLLPELRRGREQLRQLQGQHRKNMEYRQILTRQYGHLADYLRQLSDALPQKQPPEVRHYRVEAAMRTRPRENANGDRLLAFAGGESRYYLLLCDGMGTGLSAAKAGQDAGNYLKSQLEAGFPAGQALAGLNDLLTLGSAGGLVTVDMVELYLDTGYARLYKWGAPASVALRDGRAEKIGTASPPPGIALWETREPEETLSLRGGEMLILLSDGVDGEEISRQVTQRMELPPGELAAWLLHGCCRDSTDDATVVVLRLLPAEP